MAECFLFLAAGKKSRHLGDKIFADNTNKWLLFHSFIPCYNIILLISGRIVTQRRVIFLISSQRDINDLQHEDSLKMHHHGAEPFSSVDWIPTEIKKNIISTMNPYDW